MSAGADRDALRERIYGHAISQALYAATVLGIPERIRGGARTCAQLAAETGCHPQALARLLRLLAGIGVVREDADGSLSLTASGELLCDGAEGSLAAEVRHMLSPAMWRTWGELTHSVRTGAAAFPAVFGEDVWAHRARDAESGGAFAALMAEASKRETDELLDRIDLSSARTIVDVGGGHGGLLAQALARNPGARGALFDLPHAIAGADEVLAAAGVLERCRIEAGDFFRDAPPRGDAYLLRSILQNWDDARAARILASCRRAMPEHAALFVIEPLLGAHPGATESAWDLHMLVVHGGRRRTAEEHASLLANAGLAMVRRAETPSGASVLEAAGA